MKNKYILSISLVTLLVITVFNTTLTAQQAFHRGSLLVGISEGHTLANYSTSDISTPHSSLVHRSCIAGERDPIFIEYGISKHWGLGLTSGKDIFNVDPSDFYNFKTSDPANKDQIKATTSEFTFDGNYHLFVNKKLDLSVFTSLGFFTVSFKGGESDYSYNYTANGNIIRLGTKARYYFFKHLGAFGMLSSYAGSCSPKDVKGNTVAQNYSTKINGFAIEMGVCYRIFK